MLSQLRYFLFGGEPIVTDVQHHDNQYLDEDDDGRALGTSAWRRKWRDLLSALHLGQSEEEFHLDARFSLMLNLYAHHSVVDDLHQLYDREPEYVVFYLPQLCNFWLFGQGDADGDSKELQNFLLDKCKHSFVFAQRILWFLLSYGSCTEFDKHNPQPYKYSEYVQTLIERVCAAGMIAAMNMETSAEWVRMKPALLDQHETSIELNPLPDPQSPQRDASSSPTSGGGKHRADNTPPSSPSDRNNNPSETSTLVNKPSRPLPRVAAGPPHVIGTSTFRWNEAFYSELANFSEALKDIPEPERNKALRTSLRSLCDDFLPSPVLHIPVKKSRHVIVNIIKEESFCFKTKERVPFMICFEIIDHDYAEGVDMDAVHVSSGGSSRFDIRGLGERLMGTMGMLGSQLQRQISSSRPHHHHGDNQHGLELHARTPLSSGHARTTMPSDHHRNSMSGSRRPSYTDGDSSGVARTPARSRNTSEGLDSDSGESHYGDLHTPPSNMRSASHEPGPHGDNPPATSLGRSLSDPRAAGTPGGRPRRPKPASLGQWAPVHVARPRGAGFDHFSMHKGQEFERQREMARTRAKQQLQMSRIPVSVTSMMSPTSTTTSDRDYQTLRTSESIDDATPRRQEMSRSVRSVSSTTMEDDTPILRRGLGDASRHGSLVSLADSGSDSDETCSIASSATGDHVIDENMVIFTERWNEKEDRYRDSSRHGTNPGWRLVPIIVKSGDDLRQEQFASQLIAQFAKIFQEEGLHQLYLRPYDVMAVSPDSGLIEAVPDTISLDSLKKNDPSYISLKDFFLRYYGKGKAFQAAQRKFVESLAAYCIVCFLLQIKDRHNGNLLLHADGHIIHIDFGFMLSNAPGNVNFETAPFKLTTEFVQLMGGPSSSMFRRFRSLCVKGFMAARKHRQQIILLVEMMLSGNEDLPCFYAGGAETVQALRGRFNAHLSHSQCKQYVNMLIDTSLNHWRTTLYDRYQRCCVGIW